MVNENYCALQCWMSGVGFTSVYGMCGSVSLMGRLSYLI